MFDEQTGRQFLRVNEQIFERNAGNLGVANLRLDWRLALPLFPLGDAGALCFACVGQNRLKHCGLADALPKPDATEFFAEDNGFFAFSHL